MIITTAISFISLISIIVAIHEFGHYWFAKKLGVKIHEFSVGYGKTLFSKTDKDGVVWKICAIPFGGYLKMKGERNATEETNKDAAEKAKIEAKDDDSFEAKNAISKILIALAGPLFNYILSFFLIFCLLFFSNFALLKNYAHIDGKVNNSKAYDLGLREGDTIVSLNGIKTTRIQNLASELSNKAKDEKSKIIVFKADENIKKEIIIKGPIENLSIKNGYLCKFKAFKSLSDSMFFLYENTKASLQGIASIFKDKSNLKNLAGPVKIVQMSGQAASYGFIAFISFMAHISIGIGIMNLLPIPSLTDGGVILYYLYELFTGKKPSEKAQSYSGIIGVIMFLIILVVVFVNDIVGLFIR